jgi:two-component system chemotaxis response regulator CheB
LAQAQGIEVIGTAPGATKALQLIRDRKPDVVTLDIEMPGMDGLTFLETLLKERPVPVVMVSTLTERGSTQALRALELGAVDVVGKPKLDVRTGMFVLADELVAKVRAAAHARPRVGRAPRVSLAPVQKLPSRTLQDGPARVIALGASTGGTEALCRVLQALPASSPPVLIVQHMPAAFIKTFAQRLDRISRLEVREAVDGDKLRGGCALIAPGGRHMRVVSGPSGRAVRLSEEPREVLHRPSVDVLFHSCAQVLSRFATGVLMTGMGADGAAGLLAMRQAGARTIAQDEASCVVFGMPRAAIERGAAQEVLDLDAIAAALGAVTG